MSAAEAQIAEAAIVSNHSCDCPAFQPGRGERKAKVCYTVFALSDLAVSGDLPFDKAACLLQISPSPFSVNHESPAR
jgi:hypothetical protein